MKARTSLDASPLPRDERLHAAVEHVLRARLESRVRSLAFPRHYVNESEANRVAGDWLASEFEAQGYSVERQGLFSNVVARRTEAPPFLLVGAHFDSVPGTPGADDNASAVAALLEVSEALMQHIEPLGVVFVGFNREEDSLMGSTDFVANLRRESYAIERAHVLEMLGYASSAPGSQAVPGDLPIVLPSEGNFIGIVGDHRAAESIDVALSAARSHAEVPALGLCLPSGLELTLDVVRRSDHAPFWSAGIGACMWTDTAEFRNPHYHLSSDTPDTLDYEFLTQVTRMLVATVVHEGRRLASRKPLGSGLSGPGAR
ncbi:MAG: M28 family peptidase [Myxococcota bacterium]